MKNEQEKTKKETEILEPAIMSIIIPDCCREGWASCVHVVGKLKKVKQNVGL